MIRFCNIQLFLLLFASTLFPSIVANPKTDGVGTKGIQFIEISPDALYLEAIESASLHHACAGSIDALRAFFENQGLPFQKEIMRRIEGKPCHLYYRPSVKGFKAHPDNKPVSGLFFDINTSSFLSGRSGGVGDTLDIARTILSAVDRPLEVSFGITRTLAEDWYVRASPIHFPSRHGITFRDNSSKEPNPWVQDYLKSGSTPEGQLVLVTRRLFEGKSDFGESFRPMLDLLNSDGFVRSRISWEGGDLQFTQHPKDPEKLVLFYGATARNYWGDSLSDEEYEYVLRSEFGADAAVDLSGLASHVDYFVGFLPDENIALVSEPVTGDQLLAQSALQELVNRFDLASTPDLLSLASSLAVNAEEFRKRRKSVRQKLETAKGSVKSWQPSERGDLRKRLEDFVRKNCPQDPANCFSPDGQTHLLEQHLPLLQEWVTAAVESRTDTVIGPILLSVIESQLPEFKAANKRLREQKIKELEDIGFEVIRIPRVAGDSSLNVPWAGISYVNFLLVDDKLFVPAFGLGKWEANLFSYLETIIPSRYVLHPVYARHMLAYNGGVHCAAAILRE